MKNIRWNPRFALLAAVVALLGATASAQQTSGNITGRILDSLATLKLVAFLDHLMQNRRPPAPAA